MSEEKQRIVVRRVAASDGVAAHGGGGWKIAYADFMTAMMAFFLVMWLLSSATPKQREGVAEHFRMPLQASPCRAAPRAAPPAVSSRAAAPTPCTRMARSGRRTVTPDARGCAGAWTR